MKREEAIERIRQRINNVSWCIDDEDKKALETLIPELAGSEDERIRKGLVYHLQELREWKVGEMVPIKTPEHYDAWLAYLENQEDANKEYWRGYREGKQEILDKYTEIKKQKEQKPDKCNGCNNVKGCINCVDGDQWAHIEEEPANGGDLEKPNNHEELTSEDLDKISHALFNTYAADSATFLLNKIKTSVQPKQEWGEEDEKNWRAVIKCVKSGKLLKWLYNVWERLTYSKSIRPSWKPSEEQMEALKEASANWMNQEMGNSKLLESLYEGLKKL